MNGTVKDRPILSRYWLEEEPSGHSGMMNGKSIDYFMRTKIDV